MTKKTCRKRPVVLSTPVHMEQGLLLRRPRVCLLLYRPTAEGCPGAGVLQQPQNLARSGGAGGQSSALGSTWRILLVVFRRIFRLQRWDVLQGRTHKKGKNIAAPCPPMYKLSCGGISGGTLEVVVGRSACTGWGVVSLLAALFLHPCRRACPLHLHGHQRHGYYHHTGSFGLLQFDYVMVPGSSTRRVCVQFLF